MITLDGQTVLSGLTGLADAIETFTSTVGVPPDTSDLGEAGPLITQVVAAVTAVLEAVANETSAIEAVARAAYDDLQGFESSLAQGLTQDD